MAMSQNPTLKVAKLLKKGRQAYASPLGIGHLPVGSVLLNCNRIRVEPVLPPRLGTLRGILHTIGRNLSPILWPSQPIRTFL